MTTFLSPLVWLSLDQVASPQRLSLFYQNLTFRVTWFILDLLRFLLLVVPPVRLKEYLVYFRASYGLFLCSDGFNHGAYAEVFYGSQGAFGAARDEVDGFFIEGLVC